MNIIKKHKWCAAGLLVVIGALTIVGFNRRADMEVYAGSGERIVAVTREEGSGTRGAFDRMAGLAETDWLGEKANVTSDKIAVVGSTEEMLRQIELTENGIGYVSIGAADMENAKVKLLNVDGIEPSTENIAKEAYGLTRPLELVYRGELSQQESDFMAYLKSAGQGIIAETNYIPVRNEGIYLKHEVKGTIKISGSSSMAPIMAILASAYMNENPGMEIQVTTSDSEKGMKDVTEGTSNFGMVSRELYSYEEEVLHAEMLARDGIAVIVNKDNTMGNITLEQLKGIYTKDIESWDYLEAYE